MKAFKAYDIRGVYNKDFNKDDVYKVGFFLPRLLEAKTILIGRDVRESTDEIFDALCDGINDAGADVDSIGLSTTPMVYYTTAALKYDGSVMITASHNPKEYNGLKISR
jgi:phosphomannomutase